jgi:uncharacterized protein (DUF433 family)
MINFPPVTIPIRTDEQGQMRVGNTRVLLELVIHAYQHGETPEGIVDMYDSLKLSDVYAVIAYYLEHTVEIDEYMRDVQQQAKQSIAEIEARYTPQQRLLHERLRQLQQRRSGA